MYEDDYSASNYYDPIEDNKSIFCDIDDLMDDDFYEDDVSEIGYNPYMGCFDDDC